MKTITIIAEQMSDAALSAALPTRGISSVSVTAQPRGVAPAGEYRAFRNPSRFNPAFRVDLVVEDDAADTVVDGISFAYGAGVFSDAEVWVGPALALSA